MAPGNAKLCIPRQQHCNASMSAELPLCPRRPGNARLCKVRQQQCSASHVGRVTSLYKTARKCKVVHAEMMSVQCITVTSFSRKGRKAVHGATTALQCITCQQSHLFLQEGQEAAERHSIPQVSLPHALQLSLHHMDQISHVSW